MHSIWTLRLIYWLFGDKRFCRTAWAGLMSIKSSTLGDSCTAANSNQDIGRDPTEVLRSKKLFVQIFVKGFKNFVLTLTAKNDHPLTIYISLANDSKLDQGESILILLSHFSKWDFLYEYQNQWLEKSENMVDELSKCFLIRVSEYAHVQKWTRVYERENINYVRSEIAMLLSCIEIGNSSCIGNRFALCG